MFLRWHPHQRSTHQAEISTQFELGFLNWPEHHPNWDAAAVNLCKHESMSFFCVCLCVCVCVCVCVCIALACVFFRSSGWVRPLQLGRRVPFLRSPSCQRSMRKKRTKRRGWKKTFGQWHPPKARLFVSSRAFPLRKIPRIRFFFFVCVCVCVRVCSRPSSPHFLCGHFFYIPLPGILVVIIFIPRYCCRLAFIIIYASVKEVGGTGEEASGWMGPG